MAHAIRDESVACHCYDGSCECYMTYSLEELRVAYRRVCVDNRQLQATLRSHHRLRAHLQQRPQAIMNAEQLEEMRVYLNGVVDMEILLARRGRVPVPDSDTDDSDSQRTQTYVPLEGDSDREEDEEY